jgi:hypothetical protein
VKAKPPSVARLLALASLFAFAQYVVGGAILSGGVLAVSLFQSGKRAEYTRALSIIPLLVLSAAGIIRAIAVFVALRRARRK